MFRFQRKARRLPIRMTSAISLLTCCIASLLCESANSQNVQSATEKTTVHFGTEIVPLLTRLGCNSGGCHGKATGQNGFRLSLLGFEPGMDYDAIVREGRGRRIFPAAPDQSLLLLKATSQMPHGGGKRLDSNSTEYQMLFDWIAAGALSPGKTDPTLQQIDLTPETQVLTAGSTLQLSVRARFSDNTYRDVTSMCVYQSNEPEIVSVDTNGLLTTGTQRGLAAVMARFGDQIATFHTVVPFTSDASLLEVTDRKLNELDKQFGNSTIDRLLLQQWRRLGIVPSEPADDATFLRRATIDICGTLPTIAEVNEYVADQSPDRKERLIQRLLNRPEYASLFALKWADILQNRGAGYSTSQQRAGTTLFAGWIRDSLAANKPYDQFATEIVTATGSQSENPPAIWYRTVRKPTEYVESVAQAFLGVRIQCAQCHHHPAERWSQADYYGLAAVFSRVGRKGGFADAEVPTDEIIFVKSSGKTVHPVTGEILHPTALGGRVLNAGPYDDPRAAFAHWMTAPDNPFFARTMVNRMWAHFMGRGIIHPIDDARSTNPPGNPELLDALAADFASGGYDVKKLIRQITNSYAYGLQSEPVPGNAGDSQAFARYYPRRLTAEVLLDAFSQVLEVPTVFSGGPGKLPLGTRAIELPDENIPASFLDVFGRPGRMSACECERVDAPALTQALELVNSAEIHRKLTASEGYAARLAVDGRSHAERAADVFVKVLGRPAQPEELEAAISFLSGESDQAEAYRSLLWSLLATNEFMFNH